MGFEPPAESAVAVDVGYASWYYRRAANKSEPAQITIIYPTPPLEKRSASLMPVEGGRWICTLAGWLGDYPPTDPAGFLEFARSLPAPDICGGITSGSRASRKATWCWATPSAVSIRCTARG